MTSSHFIQIEKQRLREVKRPVQDQPDRHEVTEPRSAGLNHFLLNHRPLRKNKAVKRKTRQSQEAGNL
jgi:hypothetical protein